MFTNHHTSNTDLANFISVIRSNQPIL